MGQSGPGATRLAALSETGVFSHTPVPVSISLVQSGETDGTPILPPSPLPWPVEITVNGQKRSVPPGTTVEGLLTELGLTGQPAAVEVNKSLVPKRRHGETVLRPGDSIEVVTLVGGG